MRNVVVIGSNSFSGSHLIDLLLSDAANQVVGVSRSPEKSALFLPYKNRQSSNFIFKQVHLAKEPEKMVTLLDEFQPEAVINYAALNEIAPSHEHAADYFETNVVALSKVMTDLRKRSYLKRYVHISTPEVYGNCEYPLPESAPWNPSTPYAVSKAAADMYLLSLWKNFRFPVILTRATNYYGAGQQLHKVLPKTIISIKNGQRIPLHGGGAALKTWIHVQDAAHGVLRALQAGTPGEVYHLSDAANVMTVRQVIEKICAIMGVDFNKVTEPSPARLGQDARYLLDYSKAQKELEWLPTVAFDDGLRDLVQWIEQNWAEVLDAPADYQHVL